jgi:hypothetical protein
LDILKKPLLCQTRCLNTSHLACSGNKVKYLKKKTQFIVVFYTFSETLPPTTITQKCNKPPFYLGLSENPHPHTHTQTYLNIYTCILTTNFSPFRMFDTNSSYSATKPLPLCNSWPLRPPAQTRSWRSRISWWKRHGRGSRRLMYPTKENRWYTRSYGFPCWGLELQSGTI